jgi:hypothetical protein
MPDSITTAIISVAGTILVGIVTLALQQRQANRRPFLEKQLQLCFEATDAAASLATETDPTKWEQARLTFWRLYWGPLSIVEDAGVEEAMVALGEIIPKEPSPPPSFPRSTLAVRSYHLAHAARNVILPKWRVNLGELSGVRTPAPNVDQK